MKTIVYLIGCTFFINVISNAQCNLQWVHPGDNQSAIQVTKTDAQKNLYISGGGFTDLDPSSNFVVLSCYHYFAKYDNNGNLLFAKPIYLNTPSNYFSVTNMAIDIYGNIYLSAYGYGTFDFDPDTNSIVYSFPWPAKCFLLKYDANGNFVFSKLYTGDYIWLDVLFPDKKGNLWLSGDYHQNADLDPDSGSYPVFTNAYSAAFLEKFDSLGNLALIKTFVPGTNQTVYINAATIDSKNDLIFQMQLDGTVDVDPGPGVHNITGGGADYYSVVVKLDSSLNFVFANIFTENIIWNVLKCDKNDNIYYSGGFENSFDADPSPTSTVTLTSKGLHDFMLCKYDGNGNLLYARSAGGHKDDDYLELTDIDSSNNLYVWGEYNGMGTNSFGFKTTSDTDYYFAKLDSTGLLKLFQKTNIFIGRGIFAAGNSDVFITGIQYDPFDFDFGPGVTPVTIYQSNPQQFIAKYSLNDETNLIKGKCFIDYNQDSTLQTGEPALPNQIVEINPGPVYISADNEGKYSCYVDSGSFIIASPVPPPNFYDAAPLNRYASFSGFNNIDVGNNFGFTPMELVNDLVCDITDVTPIRPGFDCIYRVTFYNNGSVPLNSTGILKFDNALTFISCTGTSPVQTGDSLIWQLDTINPLQSQMFDVMFHVDSNALIGDSVLNILSAYPLAGDASPSNNIDTSFVEIQGSYDPNEKVVFPNRDFDVSEIQTGVELEYTIHFQNTGNDTAFNVTIVDKLSDQIEIPSFRIISSSHPCAFQLYKGNIASFKFNNILLPDSGSNELLSHGFIKYRIAAMKNLLPGTQIKNNAEIWFDYNTGILTNTTINNVTSVLSVPSVDQINQINLYPNPAIGDVNINYILLLPQEVKIEMFNSIGQMIQSIVSEKSSAGQKNISLLTANYDSGVYYLKITANGFTSIKKIVKM